MPGPPQLETLVTEMNCHASFTFKLNVVESGNMHVVEYGIVYSASAPINPTPTVETNTKVIFSDPFSDGAKSKVEGGPCVPHTYYRAYAILDGGTVVYGNIIHFQYT
ncbi:hypothetical protein [Dyadobacter sp. CY356]|uniref:hypothetical protein n=1 Tax=Dyadobacter sp. CY356 TaxID=2906442 RepID=UPI001F1B6D55|nr:hypothetical protein [Dyadobacter sp. CY356]MCF0056229.1 hypothetical protein [Dyadobacter sp. CY356]